MGRPARATSSYEHVADIASGGVGRVELVVRRNASFERLYARKRLHAEHRDDEDFRTMFFDEARLAGLVRHPNVVSVLDFGEDADGPFLVMDYVEGVSVAAIIQRARARGTPVALQLALRVVMEAALGLHAAHELASSSGEPLGLVHRDVSPQNILVGFDGVTRVTDFGVAKAHGRSTRTQTGVLKGKLGYMAPEQLRFEEIDRRADLFALGVVLYELLAGRRLYRNVDGHDGVRRILHEAPPDLAEVRPGAAPELVELCFSMLAKDPAHRPPSALDVARVLEEVLVDAIATEGRLDLALHLRESFADEIEAVRARARSRPAGRRARLTVRSGVVAGVALCCVIAGGLLWATMTTGATEPETHATAPVAAPPVTDADVRAPETEPLAPPPAAQAAVRDESERESAPRREARGRSRRRGEHGASASRAKVPQWDWQ